MANATKRASIGSTPFGDNGLLLPLCNTAQTIYTNALLGFNTAGYLDKFDDTKALIFAGISKEHNKIVDSGGSNGDVLIEVAQNRWIMGTFNSTLSIADIGKIVYAADDQTFSLSPGTYGNIVGKLAQINPSSPGAATATVGTVEPVYAGTRSTRPIEAALVNGAIAIKEGTVFITKGSAGAFTLADPVATVDDGKRLLIISATAFAHTVTNAGSGFNAGGAGTDVGTFGGAKGDNIMVEAYQGIWYVVSKTNVTLA